MEFCFCFYIAKRRCFEFNLSFQRSYGIYKIAHEDYYDDDENSISYHNLMNYECKTTKDSQRDSHNVFNAIKVEISTTPSLDSSTLKGINKCTNTDIIDAKQDSHNEKGVDRSLSLLNPISSPLSYCYLLKGFTFSHFLYLFILL